MHGVTNACRLHGVAVAQIIAPIELEFIFEKDYFQYLAEHATEYIAALTLVEHSHSDAAAMDFRFPTQEPAPVVTAPPEQHLQQPESGKVRGKGRGRAAATGSRTKRRRTTTSAALDSDMSLDVPHPTAAIHNDAYVGHPGVPDPTVRPTVRVDFRG